MVILRPIINNSTDTALKITLTFTRQANMPILAPPENPTEIGPASVAPYALSRT